MKSRTELRVVKETFTFTLTVTERYGVEATLFDYTNPKNTEFLWRSNNNEEIIKMFATLVWNAEEFEDDCPTSRFIWGILNSLEETMDEMTKPAW